MYQNNLESLIALCHLKYSLDIHIRKKNAYIKCIKEIPYSQKERDATMFVSFFVAV